MKIMWRVILLLLLLFSSWLLSCVNPRKQIPGIDIRRFRDVDMLWNLDSLSLSPGFSWIDSTSTVRSLEYESVPFEGHPTKVFAYYSNPDLLMGKKSAKKFPGIVLIHGGGGRAFKPWVEKWAADGYAAIAMDLGGKDGSGNSMAMVGPGQSHEFKFSMIEEGNLKDVWTYHAVASVILAHSWLLSLPEVNPAKTCVTGISWGGYLTCIVAGLDDRFKAAVPVYGCGYYNESDIFKMPLSELAPTYGELWMKYFDPSVYLPYAKASLFFINGNKDKFYNIVPYSKTYNLPQNCEKNICIKPDMQHGHLSGWQPIEIRYFFESVLNGSVSLPKIEEVQISDSIVYVNYTSIVGLRSATFYYSSDTSSLNMDRKWSAIKAQFDQSAKRISCRTSDLNFKYAFFQVSDYRELTVSSPFLVK